MPTQEATGNDPTKTREKVPKHDLRDSDEGASQSDSCATDPENTIQGQKRPWGEVSLRK